MAEVLAHAGVQTETKDPEALATTICSLLVGPARRAALGQAARMRSSRFTVETMARRTLAVYMHALDGEVHGPRVAGENENDLDLRVQRRPTVVSRLLCDTLCSWTCRPGCMSGLSAPPPESGR